MTGDAAIACMVLLLGVIIVPTVLHHRSLTEALRLTMYRLAEDLGGRFELPITTSAFVRDCEVATAIVEVDGVEVRLLSMLVKERGRTSRRAVATAAGPPDRWLVSKPRDLFSRVAGKAGLSFVRLRDEHYDELFAVSAGLTSSARAWLPAQVRRLHITLPEAILTVHEGRVEVVLIQRQDMTPLQLKGLIRLAAATSRASLGCSSNATPETSPSHRGTL